MRPSEARLRCLAQHEWLRASLLQTAALARRLLAGEAVEHALAAQLKRLRTAYAAHNTFEVEVLGPLIRAGDAWGPARMARMDDEHHAEHEALEDCLAGTTIEVARRFDELAALVDAHMAAEERTFLTVQVLHDAADLGRAEPCAGAPLSPAPSPRSGAGGT